MTAGFAALPALMPRPGVGNPFYNYRCDELIHASHELEVSSRVAVLYPTHELTGRTLLCSFTLEEGLRGTEVVLPAVPGTPAVYGPAPGAGLIARTIVEIQGMQVVDGQSPFWDSLGKHFFNMDLPPPSTIRRSSPRPLSPS